MKIIFVSIISFLLIENTFATEFFLVHNNSDIRYTLLSDPQNKKANVAQLKSSDRAYSLALVPPLLGIGTTILGYIFLYNAFGYSGLDETREPTDNDKIYAAIFGTLTFISFFSSLGLFTIGPSLGHYYTEEYVKATSLVLLRLFLIFGTAGIMNTYDNDTADTIVVISAVSLFIASIVYQVYDAPRSAQRYNEKLTKEKNLNLGIAPTLVEKKPGVFLGLAYYF